MLEGGRFSPPNRSHGLAAWLLGVGGLLVGVVDVALGLVVGEEAGEEWKYK